MTVLDDLGGLAEIRNPILAIERDRPRLEENSDDEDVSPNENSDRHANADLGGCDRFDICLW